MERRKLAKLPITKLNTGKWKYDLPPRMSETGRRQRKTFKTKELAQLSRDADLRRHDLYGNEAHSISASLAQDATKASKLLEEWDASLLEAARFYSKHRKKQAASVSFSEAWQQFEISRELKSDVHTKFLGNLGKKLNPIIGEKLMCDIDHDALRKAIRKEYKSPHLFNFALSRFHLHGHGDQGRLGS